ncbi:aldo/keto reductase [Enterovirga aerilata]|uniref:Aldo/keto reductase n=1 Tax=Enterovirga aerilata TaxID=2730920 RepID=A0A849IA73_9HYPH|nr:aldo/keto reductase [Enterovirga sp. DB1703]NNM72907.1 aldo/keto reductase [Enterovirga sp. DB1703]
MSASPLPPAPFVHANGAAIPAIGFGTWTLNGERCVEAVGWALQAGYRHIDTAARYENEVEVGEALRVSGLARDEIFVTTKVWWTDIAPGALERSAEASLGRLGLDQVDLLLIHWPNPAVPLAASTAALCRTRKLGLARHVGVSNYPSAMLDEAVRLASEPLVANQVEYHPFLDQGPVRRACGRHGMALTAYAPLGRASAVRDPTLARIAAAHGRSVPQIILRWHMQQPGIVAIPRSGSREHIVQNLDVFGFALSDEEMARISALARPDGRIIDPDFAPTWDDPSRGPPP